MSLPDLIFRFVIQIMIDVVEPIFLETTFQVHLAVILSIWSLDNRENDEPNFRFSSNLPLQWMFRNMEKFTKNLPQHNWWDKRQRVLKVLKVSFGSILDPKNQSLWGLPPKVCLLYFQIVFTFEKYGKN